MNLKASLVIFLSMKIIFTSFNLHPLDDKFSPVDYFVNQYNSHKVLIDGIRKKDAINLLRKVASIVKNADEKLSKVKQNSKIDELYFKRKLNQKGSIMRF